VKKFKVVGRDITSTYEVYDEDGKLVGLLDTITLKISSKKLRPIVTIMKNDGTTEEGFIDNLTMSGTIQK
jgi:sporulation protein YlmC with PRC-barrel domain